MYTDHRRLGKNVLLGLFFFIDKKRKTRQRRLVMSEISSSSSIKEKKRPSVSPKCLLNIKSIVTHNVSLNNNHRILSIRAPPPLPLAVGTESIDHQENQRKKSQLSSSADLANELIQKLKISK